jgi:hypothetical protein
MNKPTLLHFLQLFISNYIKGGEGMYVCVGVGVGYMMHFLRISNK